MKLIKLAPSQRVKGRWLLYLEDGSLLRVGENEVLGFGLYAGMDLTGERLAELTASAARSALREKALAALAARPMSRKELIGKLTAKPRRTKEGTDPPAVDPAAAEEAADWLEDLGYLNDEAYASTVVRHYAGKGYGERKLRDELYRRGVPRDLWTDALEQAEDPSGAIDAFVAKKLAGKTPDQQELKKVSDALARRGYRWPDISDALRRYGAETGEEY